MKYSFGIASALRQRCHRMHPCTSSRTWVRPPGRGLSHGSDGSAGHELFHPTLTAMVAGQGYRYGIYVWVVVSGDAVDCIAGGQRDCAERQGDVS